MGYGRPIKYTKAYMDEFMSEFKRSGLSLRSFCSHKKVPYVSIKVAIKRWKEALPKVDRIPVLV